MERRRQPVIDLPFRRPGNLPRRRSEAADIDLADIQGNVLRGYTFPTAAYIFLRIDDVDRARALMSATLTEVATAEPWEDGPPATATHARLHLLRPADARRARRDPRLLPGRVPRGHGRARRAPRRPRPERARALGAGPGHRRGARAHHGLRDRQRAPRRAPRRCCASSARRTARRRSINETRAEALAGGKDHFGFFDGIAQPALSPAAAWRRARATASPTAPAAGATSAPASSCTATSTRTAACPTPPRRRSTATGRSRSTASSQTDVAAFRAYMRGEGARLPRRPRHAGGEDRRALARRHAAGDSRPTVPTPRHRRRPRADQRLRLRRRPAGAALPAGRAHPPRQPARRRGLLQGPDDQPPPHHPPRAHVRAAAARGRHGGRRPGARARRSSASTRASGASSRPSRRCGSTTATRSGSVPTRTSSSASPTATAR